MQSIKNSEYLEYILPVAVQAGELIMHYFVQGHEVSQKSDNSPVTNADIAASEFIVGKLKALAPALAVITEEDDANHGITNHAPFWLVDPLDGTRAFVAGEPEFTVNIALIEEGVPILGVIFVPAQSLLYYGAAGLGAFRVKEGGAPEKIHVRAKPEEGVTVVRSKSHPSAKTEAFLNTLKIKELVSGSSSVKFCQVAEASADIYPRFGRTMEWDTAAGHAILNAAGGKVVVAETGEVLAYGKAGFENPHFIAYGFES